MPPPGRRASRLTATILACAACILSVGASPRSSDPAELRERLRQAFTSIDSLQFTCESWATDAAGNPDGLPSFFFEISVASGDRRALKIFFGENGQPPRLMQDTRQDGAKRIDIQHMKNDSSKIDAVFIKNAENPGAVFQGDMNEALWLFAPDGLPLYSYVGPETVVEELRDNQGNLTLVFSAPITRKRTIRCELDPRRDNLPRRLTLVAGKYTNTYETREFHRDNGRWFPSRGTQTTIGPKGTTYRSFVVRDLKINRGVPDSVFRVPSPLEAGVVVLDRTSRTPSRIVGGFAARRKLIEANPSSFPDSAIQNTSKTAKPPTPITGWLIGLITFASVCVAAFIVYRLIKKHSANAAQIT